jgi:rSAM/selenodomain-associated transferase 1
MSELTPHEACAVHEELLLHTVTTLCAARLAPVELWLDRAGDSVTVDRALQLGAVGPHYQRGADLGARMYTALSEGLTRAERVVLVGSDCPTLDVPYLQGAFDALLASDVVLGPAEDGGFVLIGCRRLADRALANVPWGAGDVLRQTLLRLHATGLSVALLAPRADVDTPADLRRWRARSSGVGGD